MPIVTVMNHKRSVVVAGALSALLLGASGAFAVGSGLLSSGVADKVGTFQAIEQAAAKRGLSSNEPARTPWNESTSTSSASPAAQDPAQDNDSVAAATPPAAGSTVPETGSHGFQPPAATSHEDEAHGTTTTETSPPPTIDPSTTSTSHPEHEVEPPDNGRGSDD